MKRWYKTVLLVFSLSLWATRPCNDIKSCSFSPTWSEFRAVFFEPGIYSEGMEPFFVTQKLFNLPYYCCYIEAPAAEATDRRRNCLEWQAFTGKDVSLDDIMEVIYQSAPDQFITAHAEDSLASVFPGNTFIKKLLTPAMRPALTYMVFAKRFEFMQRASDDPWGFDEPASPWPDSGVLAQTAQKNLQAAATPFMRRRWAYQLISAQYYDRDSSFKQTFFKHFSLEDPSVLAPWALTKVADAEPVGKANYYLFKIFEACRSKRTLAVLRFISAKAEAALPFARSPLERAGIIAMRAMQNPGRGLQDLKTISAYTVQSPYLPLLIAREINKIEDWTLTHSLTGHYSGTIPETDDYKHYMRHVSFWTRKNIEKDKVYLETFKKWLQTLDRRTTPKQLRAYVRLALAHLCWMQQDATNASRYLNSVPASADARMRWQIALQRVLLLALQRNLNSAKTQNELAAQLVRLRNEAKTAHFRNERLSRVYLWLSHAFFHKGNQPLAGLFFNRSFAASRIEQGLVSPFYRTIQYFDRLASVQDMDRLLRMQSKKKKSPLENFLFSSFTQEEIVEDNYWMNEEPQASPVPSRHQLLDVQGVIAFREGDFKKAYACFRQIPDSFWQTQYEYVYYLNKDFFAGADRTPHAALEKAPVGRAAFVKKLLELEEAAQRGPADQRAHAYYMLGNGHYEASYWGRAWMMFCYGKGAEDESEYMDPKRRSDPSPSRLSYSLDPKRYGDVYLRCSRAVACYERCLQSNPSPELAALATFKLLLCRQNIARSAGTETTLETGFRKWARRYGRTSAFEDILEECPTLQYLRK